MQKQFRVTNHLCVKYLAQWTVREQAEKRIEENIRDKTVTISFTEMTISIWVSCTEEYIITLLVWYWSALTKGFMLLSLVMWEAAVSVMDVC